MEILKFLAVESLVITVFFQYTRIQMNMCTTEKKYSGYLYFLVMENIYFFEDNSCFI